MKPILVVLAVVSVGGAAVSAGAAQSKDRHAGYYYPPPAKVETYTSRARPMPDVQRRQRVLFVVGMVEQMTSRPYPPQSEVFVKGKEAEKLIVIGNEDGRLNTIYRVRGLLGRLTSTARTLPILQEYGVADTFNFLDLLKLLGFSQITVSDGVAFTHQIKIK